MTALDWSNAYATLKAENDRQQAYRKTLMWLLPALYLGIGGIVWLLPFDEIRPLAYILCCAAIIVALVNAWQWRVYAVRPMTMVQGTVRQRFSRRDGGKGSTAKKYFLKLESTSIQEITTEGLGTTQETGKTKKLECSSAIHDTMQEGTTAQFLVLSNGYAIGYINNEQAVFPPHTVSLMLEVFSTIAKTRKT